MDDFYDSFSWHLLPQAEIFDTSFNLYGKTGIFLSTKVNIQSVDDVANYTKECVCVLKAIYNTFSLILNMSFDRVYNNEYVKHFECDNDRKIINSVLLSFPNLIKQGTCACRVVKVVESQIVNKSEVQEKAIINTPQTSILTDLIVACPYLITEPRNVHSEERLSEEVKYFYTENDEDGGVYFIKPNINELIDKNIAFIYVHRTSFDDPRLYHYRHSSNWHCHTNKVDIVFEDWTRVEYNCKLTDSITVALTYGISTLTHAHHVVDLQNAGINVKVKSTISELDYLTNVNGDYSLGMADKDRITVKAGHFVDLVDGGVHELLPINCGEDTTIMIVPHHSLLYGIPTTSDTILDDFDCPCRIARDSFEILYQRSNACRTICILVTYKYFDNHLLRNYIETNRIHKLKDSLRGVLSSRLFDKYKISLTQLIVTDQYAYCVSIPHDKRTYLDTRTILPSIVNAKIEKNHLTRRGTSTYDENLKEEKKRVEYRVKQKSVNVSVSKSFNRPLRGKRPARGSRGRGGRKK